MGAIPDPEVGNRLVSWFGCGPHSPTRRHGQVAVVKTDCQTAVQPLLNAHNGAAQSTGGLSLCEFDAESVFRGITGHLAYGSPDDIL